MPTATLHAAGTSAGGPSPGAPTVPAGASVGDQLLAFIAVGSATTPTGPAGWTQVTAIPHPNVALNLSVWKRTCQSGDPGTSFSWPLASQNFTCVIHAYSNVVGIDTSNTATSLSSSSRQAPAVTTTIANDLLVEAWSIQGATGTTLTPPATSRTNATGTSVQPHLAVSDQLQASVGASSTGSCTASTNSAWCTITVALKGDNPPDAPTLTSPANSTSIDRTSSNAFTWTFSDPDSGDSQSAFDLQYRVVGAGSWTTVSQTTPTSSYTFAANSLAAGNYEWQVRTYDSQGTVGAWTASSFFTAANPPATPTITTPTAGGTVNSTPSPVTWSAPNQTDYQVRRVADSAGSPNTGTVYSDTGDVVDSSARTVNVAFPTNSRDEHVEVRIKYAGLWSAWADVLVHVSYSPPPAPTPVTATPHNTTATITVAWTNPAPGGGQVAATSVDLYRSTDGGATSIRVAASLAVNSNWTDYTPASGVAYSYQVVATAANGVQTASSWIT